MMDKGTPELIKFKALLNPYLLRIDDFLANNILNNDQHRAGIKLTRWHDAWAIKYNVRTSNFDPDYIRSTIDDDRENILTNADLYSKTMNEMVRNHKGMGIVVLAIIVDQLSLNEAMKRFKCRKDTAKHKIRLAFDALCEAIDYVEGLRDDGLSGVR